MLHNPHYQVLQNTWLHCDYIVRGVSLSVMPLFILLEHLGLIPAWIVQGNNLFLLDRFIFAITWYTLIEVAFTLGASDQLYNISGLQAGLQSRLKLESMLIAWWKLVTMSASPPASPTGRGLNRTSIALHFLQRTKAIYCKARLVSVRFRSRRDNI